MEQKYIMPTELSVSSLVDLPDNVRVEKSQLRKLLFIANALEQGWTIKKSTDSYIFTKKHENRREIFQENYLENFLISNFSNSDILR
jgi:hypothetical protein